LALDCRIPSLGLPVLNDSLIARANPETVCDVMAG
jgi:hypothetical protein